MKTSFTLIANNRVPWSEEDLAGKDAAALAGLLPGLMPLYGMLTIEDEDEGETLVITDDLDAVVGEMCLYAPAELAAGNPVTYSLSAHAESVTLTPDGDRIEVEGSDVDDSSFDSAQMLAALVDCGARYVAFKEKQWSAPGDTRLATLRTALKHARNAVG